MIKRITIPVYLGTLVLIQLDDLMNIPAQWKPADSNLCGYDGITYFVENYRGYRFFVIAVTENTSSHVIAHEALHCVNKIFEHRGIEYSLVNDEHAAYLLGWIVRQCHKYFK
jgi:hypothetical protein